MRYALCTLLVFVIIYIGCKKDNNSNNLPVLNNTGENILACKINGKIFVSRGVKSMLSDGVIYTKLSDTTLYIYATSYNPAFKLSITCPFSPYLGTFQIGSDPFNNGASFNDDSNGTLSSNGNYFYTNSNHSGKITFNYYLRGIVSGNFSFDAVNDDDSIIHITEGEFDIANH